MIPAPESGQLESFLRLWVDVLNRANVPPVLWRYAFREAMFNLRSGRLLPGFVADSWKKGCAKITREFIASKITSVDQIQSTEEIENVDPSLGWAALQMQRAWLYPGVQVDDKGIETFEGEA